MKKKEVKPDESLMKWFDIILNTDLKSVPKEAKEKAYKSLKEKASMLTPISTMERDRFIQDYVVNFLSAHVVSEYTDRCMRGTWLEYKPPVEDAFSLAEQAWLALTEVSPDKCAEYKIGVKK